MSTELPDWVQEGAHVAEQSQGSYAFTTIKRITETLIVLTNGSRYRRKTMRKVGETSEYSRTYLRTADDAYGWLIRGTVRRVADAASRSACRVSEENADPTEALAQVAAAVALAQRKLAELLAARAAIQNPEEG